MNASFETLVPKSLHCICSRVFSNQRSLLNDAIFPNTSLGMAMAQNRDQDSLETKAPRSLLRLGSRLNDESEFEFRDRGVEMTILRHDWTESSWRTCWRWWWNAASVLATATTSCLDRCRCRRDVHLSQPVGISGVTKGRQLTSGAAGEKPQKAPSKIIHD